MDRGIDLVKKTTSREKIKEWLKIPKMIQKRTLLEESYYEYSFTVEFNDVNHYTVCDKILETKSEHLTFQELMHIINSVEEKDYNTIYKEIEVKNEFDNNNNKFEIQIMCDAYISKITISVIGDLICKRELITESIKYIPNPKYSEDFNF